MGATAYWLRKQRFVVTLVLAGLLAGVLLPQATGDVVRLLSGDEIRGRIVKDDGYVIVIEVPDGRITVLRDEVLQTVDSPEAVDEEIRYLFEAMGS